MADFDWWPLEKLENLASELRSTGETIPPADDEESWQTAADRIGYDADAEGSLAELAGDVHAEMEGWEESVINDTFFGDLNLAESRLMLTVKNVRGIAYVASHLMDTLWRDDGIAYHTLIVPPTTSAHELFATQLVGLCAFVRANSPALVCSSCPKLLTAVAAATLLDSGDAVDASSAIDSCRGTGLDKLVGSVELQALELFAEAVKERRAPALQQKHPHRLRIDTEATSPGKRPATTQDDDDDSHCGLSPKLRALSATETGGMSRMRARVFKREERQSEEAL